MYLHAQLLIRTARDYSTVEWFTPMCMPAELFHGSRLIMWLAVIFVSETGSSERNCMYTKLRLKAHSFWEWLPQVASPWFFGVLEKWKENDLRLQFTGTFANLFCQSCQICWVFADQMDTVSEAHRFTDWYCCTAGTKYYLSPCRADVHTDAVTLKSWSQFMFVNQYCIIVQVGSWFDELVRDWVVKTHTWYQLIRVFVYVLSCPLLFFFFLFFLGG